MICSWHFMILKRILTHDNKTPYELCIAGLVFTWVWFLGWEDPLEKGKATHSSILTWRIPWTIQSMGSHRVRHDWSDLAAAVAMVKKVSESHSVVSDSLWPHGLYSPWNSPGQYTWVGSLSLLQGLFPTQGLNPGLMHCRWTLYELSHKGSPRTLGWVAYPFSGRSTWSRHQTGVSCIAGRFFTRWVMEYSKIQVWEFK